MITHETLQGFRGSQAKNKIPKVRESPLGLSSSSVPGHSQLHSLCSSLAGLPLGLYPMQLFTPRGFLVFCFLLEDSDHSLHSVNSHPASGSDLRKPSLILYSNRSTSALCSTHSGYNITFICINITFIYNITFLSAQSGCMMI